jgi:hypothetical protein
MPSTLAASDAGVVERCFQLLAVDVRIRTDCQRLDRRLDALVQDARQDYPLSASLDFDVRRRDGQYHIQGDSGEARTEFDVDAAFTFLYRACYARATEALPASSVFLHAACGSHAGRRFLLVGDSGVGKTTLIMRVAHEGGLVESDDLVILQPNGLVGLPRRFNVKEGSLALLPWLAAGLDRIPSFSSGYQARTYSFAPSEWGFPWHLRNAPIDAVFYLDPNHGGQPRISELPRYHMAQLAIGEARIFDQRNRGWIAELCSLLDRAACFRLVVGGLDSTAAMLLKKLRNLPIVAGGTIRIEGDS